MNSAEEHEIRRQINHLNGEIIKLRALKRHLNKEIRKLTEAMLRMEKNQSELLIDRMKCQNKIDGINFVINDLSAIIDPDGDEAFKEASKKINKKRKRKE
jgi:hypothetical protein